MSHLRQPSSDLSVSEKLQILEDLWDEIALNQSDIPVHEWQKEELDRRQKNLQADPGSARSWELIQRAVRADGKSD